MKEEFQLDNGHMDEQTDIHKSLLSCVFAAENSSKMLWTVPTRNCQALKVSNAQYKGIGVTLQLVLEKSIFYTVPQPGKS